MFSLAESFQRQGLVGLGAISSMIFDEDGEEYKCRTHPDMDDVPQVQEDVMDIKSIGSSHDEHHLDNVEQVVTENADHESLEEKHHKLELQEIPFEYDVENETYSEYLPRHCDAADAVIGCIPYEDDEVYDSQLFRRPEGKFHHILDIPYEDDDVKPIVGFTDFDAIDHENDIPYEHDTVTTSSAKKEEDEAVDEIKKDLGSHPVEMDDSEEAIRSLFESMSNCEADIGIRNDNAEIGNEEKRRDAALTDLLESLNAAEAMPVSNVRSFVGDDIDYYDETQEMVYENDEHEDAEYIEESGLGWLPGFTVNVEVRPTPHLGVNQYGVFALQDVPAKHLVWKWTRRLQAYHHSEIETYIQTNYHEDDLEGIRMFLRRGVVPRAPSESHFVSALTDSFGFLNCSASPNCRHQRATRDIYKGEELTLDYNFYSNPQWYVEVCHKYGIMTGPEIAVRQAKFGDDRFFSAEFVGDDTAENDAWLARYLSQMG
jgi:hypothetical protein